MVHLQTVLPKAGLMVQAMKAVPPENIQDSELNGVQGLYQHAGAHLQALQTAKKQLPPKTISQFENAIEDGNHELELMVQARQAAQAVAMALAQRERAATMNQPFEPEETQVGPNGAPPPNGAQMEELNKAKGQAVGALHRDKRV